MYPGLAVRKTLSKISDLFCQALAECLGTYQVFAQLWQYVLQLQYLLTVSQTPGPDLGLQSLRRRLLQSSHRRD